MQFEHAGRTGCCGISNSAVAFDVPVLVALGNRERQIENGKPSTATNRPPYIPSK